MAVPVEVLPLPVRSQITGVSLLLVPSQKNRRAYVEALDHAGFVKTVAEDSRMPLLYSCTAMPVGAELVDVEPLITSKPIWGPAPLDCVVTLLGHGQLLVPHDGVGVSHPVEPIP